VRTTQGLGAGSLPDIGRAAAEESLDEILEHIANAHMLFVTAGMGGGTGTGAAPVIARAAKERNLLTVGVVTKPFHFEGARRMRIAMAGIEALQKHVDTLLIIPNQNLFSIANEKTTFHEAFAMADQVLHSGVRGITDLMVMPGLINLDFNDVRTVMSEMGKAMMGTGEAEGDKRAIRAAEAAISNPLLDEVSMKGARGVLINITGSMDMTLFEVDEAANRIRAEVDPDANIIVGSTFNQELEGRVRVSVVATGIDTAVKEQGEQKTSVTVSKPWREVQTPATSVNFALNPAPAPKREPAPVQVAPAATQPMAPPPVPHPLAPSPTPAANPVGDVHERIRRMLMEGTETDAGVRPAPAARKPAAPAPAVQQASPPPRVSPAEAADNGRNPFRDAQEIGRQGLNAAFDIFKSLGGASARPDEPSRTPPRAQPVRGDLFDDEADAELEIPSFLRKKKTGS
jgi:cell division protein FtsZ